jgi:hypothetical protein
MQIRLLIFFLCIGVVGAAQQLIRGPYLQAATDNSIHVRWRTDITDNSRVQWGTSAGNLAQSKSGASPVTDHEIIITGLTPNTKYWYSIGNTTLVLQGDADNYFMTLPSAGAKTKIRVGVIGDCGNNSVNQLNVRNELQNYLGSNYMNAWILLGDNAYLYGLDAEYQAEFFNIYKDRFLKQNPLYPSPGNHDYSDNPALQENHQMPYYDVFSMPIAGEAGGFPSNNEAYYSFNIGNVHFLSLDAFGKEDNSTRLYDTLGKQVQWIKQDLQANQNKDWIVAYWHHPPFSLGSRNGETEADMTAIRTNFIRILERYGVDLILTGHSHNYERSRLQKDFFGFEASFNSAQHNLSSSSALYDGSTNSCPYVKDTITSAGTIYAVAGSGGQLGSASAGYPHDAMYYSNTSVGGSMILEIEDNRLDAKWICADGIIRDKFTMMKKVNTKRTVVINNGDSVVLSASFIGSYNWAPGGQATKSIKVAPSVNSTYYVNDAFSCVRDTINVTVNNVALPIAWGSIKGWYHKEEGVVHLTWKLIDERDVNHFIIERSANGIQFMPVGTIASSGNPPSPVSYLFKDAGIDKINKSHHYRIRQVNNSGSIKYSPAIIVNLSAINSDFDVQLIPNPAHSINVKIRIVNSNMNTPASVSIADALGKTIATKQIILTSSPQSFMPLVQPGIYFVSIRAENYATVIRVVLE